MGGLAAKPSASVSRRLYKSCGDRWGCLEDGVGRIFANFDARGLRIRSRLHFHSGRHVIWSFARGSGHRSFQKRLMQRGWDTKRSGPPACVTIIAAIVPITNSQASSLLWVVSASGCFLARACSLLVAYTISRMRRRKRVSVSVCLTHGRRSVAAGENRSTVPRLQPR